MANYIDLSTLHSPTPRAKPSAAWGAQIRENLEFLHDNRRVICTSSTRPSSPFEGLEIYETDTDRIYIYTGSIWQQIGGLGQWTNYTPTVSQVGTVSKTVNYSRYYRHGRMIVFSAYLSLTSSGTAGTSVSVSTPADAVAAAFHGVGSFYFFRNSGSVNYAGTVLMRSVSTLGFLIDQAGEIGNNPNFAVANGDRIQFTVTYEATS